MMERYRETIPVSLVLNCQSNEMEVFDIVEGCENSYDAIIDNALRLIDNGFDIYTPNNRIIAQASFVSMRRGRERLFIGLATKSLIEEEKEEIVYSSKDQREWFKRAIYEKGIRR